MSEKKTNAVEQWSVKRWGQLERLEKLLIQCESLDSGSSVIHRMKFIIKEAKALRAWNYDNSDLSFIRFLQEQARDGYEKRKPRKSAKDEPAGRAKG